MKVYNIPYSLAIFMFIILYIGSVSASLDNLGTVKQNTCIQLTQTCATCTYNNITLVISPLGSYSINGEYVMTKSGQNYNYTFCGTSQIGLYSVSGHGDLDGKDKTFSYNFEVTPSGFLGTLGFYLILILVLSLVVLLGFSIKEEWFVVLGGMGLMLLGIYSINFGVAGFRDMFMTWGLGIFEIAIGAILSIGAGIQKMESD